MKRILAVACAAGIIACAGSARAVDFDELYPLVNGEISGGRAFEYVKRIWRYDKWSTLPMWQKSAAETVAIMEERGFDEASLVKTPADGVTKHGDWTNPVGWDCRQATLEVVEPKGLPEEYRFLCNYQVNPTSLTFFSAPTPPGGIEAELVILDGSDPDLLDSLDVRGKIILVNRGAGRLKRYLSENGILGVVSDRPISGHPGENAWLNTWSDVPGGWLMTASDAKDSFCFSISQRKGEFLRGLLKGGKTVKLRAKIDGRYYTDSYLPYVTGVVEGSGPERQEVLIGGHLFEWGANDNATGCAVMLEAVGTLNDLIRAGKLPRPRRSIRIWMGQEMYGSLPFVEDNIDRLRRTVAVVCMDTPAPDWDLNSATVRIFMNPDVCPTYTDAILPEFFRRYYERTRARKVVLIEPFEGGTDTYFCEPMIGAPTNFVYMENGTNLHHNSRDTIEKVDRRSLRDLCTVAALYLYFMADAGIDEVPFIASLTYRHGVNVLIEKSNEAYERMLRASDGAELGRALEEGTRAIDYYTGQRKKALESILRLVSADGKKDAERTLDLYIGNIGELGRLQREQFRDAVKMRAKALSMKIVSYSREKEPWEDEAKKLYPRATKPGTLTLEGIPETEWKEVTRSPRWWSPRNWPASSYWWCDGTRSLLEIRGLVELEAGREMRDFNLVEYYRFLEKNGYVEFVEK